MKKSFTAGYFICLLTLNSFAFAKSRSQSALPLSADPFELPEAHLVFSLPREWRVASQRTIKEGTCYIFKREPVIDSNGVAIIPNLAFFIQNIPVDLNLIQYAGSEQSRLKNVEVIKVLTWNKLFTLNNAIGYLCQYVDPDKILHDIYVLYAIHESKGVSVIIDGTASVFRHLNPEYKFILKSIQGEPPQAEPLDSPAEGSQEETPSVQLTLL